MIRRSVLILAALLAAFTIFAVNRVPFNETVYDIKGNLKLGGQEAISTFSCDKHDDNFQGKNSTKPAEKANAQEADGLRDSLKNDFTPVDQKPIDDMYQGTPQPLSTEDHIAGAKQQPDAYQKSNSSDQQAGKEGISPDLKRPNTTRSQLQDGLCLSDFSIQKFERMQLCKSDILMLDDKLKNQIQSVKAEIQSKERITPLDRQLMYSGTQLEGGSALSHQTQTSAPDTPLTKLSRTKDVVHVAHVVQVAHSSAVMSATTNTLSGQKSPKKTAVLGAFNRVKVTTETSHGTTAASTFSEGTPFSIVAIAPTLNSKIFANPNLRFLFVKPNSDCSVISQSGDKTENNFKTAPKQNPASQQNSKVTAHPESTTASSCNQADQTCLNSYFSSAFLKNPNQCSFFDPACMSNKFDQAQMACQGEKVCGISHDAVVTTKQSKTVPHPERNLDSPADPITSRANNTTEKVYSKKKVNPCYCLLEELSKNLTKFLKSSNFRKMQIGDSPRAQTISLNETVSEEFGEICWFQLCGKLTFTAQSSHLKPFGRLAWAEHHTQTYFRGRRLGGISIPSGPCSGSTTNFNLLDTTVVASQSYGEPPGGGCTNGQCNANANQGCDGVIKITSNGRVHVHPVGDYYWVATLLSSKWIQSILYIESQFTANVSFRVGELTTNGYLNNPLCLGGSLTKGGWLNCARQGKYLALTSTINHFEFMEVMAFSEKFVHHQALSSTLSPGTLTTASPYDCTISPNCQASNAKRTTLVIWNDFPTTANEPCCIYSITSTDPALTVTFPQNVMIAFVVIIPSDQGTSVTAWQTDVNVYIVNASNVQELCGTLADYNTYKEVPCNRVGHKIIIQRPGSSKTLSMAGLGIMTTCDCSQTSFDPLLISPVTSYAFSGLSTDALKTVKVMPDTVSSVCGLADGYSFCPHSISFTDSSNNPVTFPYNGFTWNAASFILTLNPAQALQFCSLNAIVSVTSNPSVTRTQVITSTIIQAPSTPTAPVTAISGTTDVAINWTAPADNGSAITEYSVDIRQIDGVTYSTYAGCTGIAVSCTFPISVLQAAPYNLGAGSSVFAKVKARNAIGTSAYSLAGNGAVLTAPSAPAAPISAISGTDVTITWTAPAQGSTPMTGYNLQILQSDGVTYSTYTGCTGIAVSCTVPISVLQAAPYNLFAGSSVLTRVKATNSIGSSVYSSAGNGAVIPPAPNTPAAPVTAIQGTTDVAIAWIAPPDGGSAITGYNVAILQSDGVTYSTYAGCTGIEFSCTVPISVLQSAPFSLASGASVYAQVQAINVFGASAASNSGNGAVIPPPANTPAAPAAPVTAISGTDITITWVAPSDGGSAITEYTVKILQSDNLTYSTYAGCTGTAVSCSVPISVLQAAPFNLASGASVYAQVQAINVFGASAASTSGNGAVIPPPANTPAAPAAPVTAISGTDVTITWVAPSDGGSAITEYTVKILQSDNLTYSTYAGCTGNAVSCSVPISVLQAAPFNLQNGSSVQAKVQAINVFGASAASTSGNGAVLPKIPQIPVQPTSTTLGTNVVINWVAPADGGSVITDYAVTIKQSDGTWSAPLAICTGTAVSCTVAKTVLQAAPYNLPNGASVYAQVQAINSKGISAASPSGNGAVLATVPITPEAPATSISSTKVLITWKAPADGGSEITGYKVVIQQSDGTWSAPLISCTGIVVSCSIPISVLQAAPYNIAEGTSIYASVIATNLAGSSSSSNPGNGAVVKLNPLSIFLPNLTLNAVIGQEASLFLPPLAGAVFIVFSRPKYQLQVDGNLLKVKSESVQDIGSQKLQMNARASGVSGNFTVNVIFSEEVTVADTATNTTNTSIMENLLLSVLESDSLLKTTLFCTTKEAEILSCVTEKGYSYSIDPKKIVGFAKVGEEPILTVTRVNSRGQFFLKFSQAMKIEAFKNTTYYKRHQDVNATTQNDTFVQYKYLLSPKHLRIEVMKYGSTTQPVFTWYARNITNNTIEMQLVFENPQSISNDRKSSYILEITVLPPALRFFQTISSGAVTKNPLTKFLRKLPPQVKLGSVMDYVIQGAEIMEKSAQYAALTNLAVQLAVSGSMAQMWSMVNALQIVNSFNYLETDVPGNVLMVMTKFNDMLDLSALETGQITSALFNFTETQSPGAAFTEMGDDSKVFTEFIGNLFYFGVLGSAVYLLYGLVHCCVKSNKTCKIFQLWLSSKFIFSAALCYQLETYFDFSIGSLLKFEEPNLNTGSDIFDFSLAIGVVICLLVLPLTQVTCLCKNKDKMDERKFKKKWGSLYTELKTYTPEQRETAIKMLSWFLFRRIVTALNLVELRDQTILLQLTFNMYLCLADACVNFHWSHYESNLRNIMEKLNSFVVLLLSQLMYMQTDLIPSEADRYYIGYYYLGVTGLMFLVNMSVVIVAASISATEKCKKFHVQRQHSEALALRKTQMELKKSKVAQKNVVDGPLPSRRTLLLLEISAQKIKPVVDEAKLKQLQARLVALDNNLRDQRSNVPQEVSIESDLEIGSSHRQAERLVDQINEITFYENKKKEEKKNFNDQSLSEIESEGVQMSSVLSSNEDQSEQIHQEVVLSVLNKAQLIRQPNEDKKTQTQLSNKNRDTRLQRVIYSRVMPANKDTQEPARLKPVNRKLITKSLKPVEPFSFRDICMNDSDIIDVNKSYSLGHLEKHFEKVRNDSNDQPIVFGFFKQLEETKTKGPVDRRKIIHTQKIRVQEAEIDYIQEQEAVLLNSLQKNIQACDEISVLLESASEMAWAALQKEARQIKAEMVKKKAQIRELQEQLAFHKAELDRLRESNQL